MKGFLTTFVMLEVTGKQIGIFLFVSFDFPYFVPAPGTESKSSLLWEDFLFFSPLQVFGFLEDDVKHFVVILGSIFYYLYVAF